MKTTILTSLLLALLAGLAAACGNHDSTQDATKLCNDERREKNTVDDTAFKACVACHEDCGSDCQALNTSPETYRCSQ